MAQFRLLQGRNEIGSYRFDEGTVRIGRKEDCEIRINDEAVSRNHAEVSRQGESWVLRLREARNGIFVNGNLISIRVLKSGDRIEIGHFVIQFDDEGAASTSPAPAEQPEWKAAGENTTVTISLSDVMKIHNMNKDLMGAHLAWYGDTEAQNIVGLSDEKTLIGSHETCQARVPEGPGSSGLCAAVVKTATGYDLEPLKDSSDLKLNAVRVLKAERLNDGDRIQLGAYILQFHEPLE